MASPSGHPPAGGGGLRKKTTNQLRFSVLVLPNVPWPELLRRCQQVEALGFDPIGLADHLVDWAGGKDPGSSCGRSLPPSPRQRRAFG